MNKSNLIIFLLFYLVLSGCKTEKKFPTDKKYWDTNDYDNVVRELTFGTKADEKLPTFDDPETKIIVEKLTDQQNFKVILEDKELGLTHKNEMAESFFKIWQDMNTIYSQLDRKDLYVYEKEKIEVYNFGLALQLQYFKLGNDEIIEKSDDPNSEEVKSSVESNKNALVSNFMNYLDEINNEKSYSNIGLDLISNGIDKYFTALINLYPNYDYGSLIEKIVLLTNKTKSENIKQSLLKLKQHIEYKKSLVPAAKEILTD